MAPNALHGRYAAVCRVSLRARAQASRRSDFPECQVPERLWIRLPEAAPLRSAARKCAIIRPFREGVSTMAKGQQRPKTNNKPKLTVKEKKEKKKEKAAKK